MIEEQAVVVENDGQYIWVATERQSSCGHCSAKNSCGTQVLSKVLGNKATSLRCVNTLEHLNLQKGDQVIVGLEESALLSGSFLIYLLPLLLMILGAGSAVFFAKIYAPGSIDLFAALASLSGLFLGLYLAHNIAHKGSSKYSFEAQIVCKIANDGVFKSCQLSSLKE